MYAGHALGQAIVQHDVHLQVLAKRHLVRHADAEEHVLEHLLVRAVSKHGASIQHCLQVHVRNEKYIPNVHLHPSHDNGV